MRIKVYQIDQNRDEKHAKFCGLKDLSQLGETFRPENYNEVFDGEVDCATLEGVYTLFNTDHPPTHRGHSLSVSDVIEIVESFNRNLHGCYYCDEIGFASIDFDTSMTHKPDNLLDCVVLEPGKPAYASQVANGLKSLQRAVGGLIEIRAPFTDDAVTVSNDEAKLIGMEGNRKIHGELYAGTVLILGDKNDGDLCSLSESQLETYTAQLAEPEFYTPEDVEESIGFSFQSF